MSLSIGRMAIGEADMERALRDALGELGVPISKYHSERYSFV